MRETMSKLYMRGLYRPRQANQGDTLEELMKNAKEAIELYLETLTEEEKRTSCNREWLEYRK